MKTLAEIKLGLWCAIHDYVQACGGDTSKHVYGNLPRQEAVNKIEAAFHLLTEQNQWFANALKEISRTDSGGDPVLRTDEMLQIAVLALGGIEWWDTKENS